MKKFLILIFVLLFCGQAWGAQDTLQPAADQTTRWTHVGCSEGSYYQCMDDPPGSPDSTVTYAHTIGANCEYFRVESTFVADIDSVVVRVNARKDGYEDSTVYLYMGFGYYFAGDWEWQTTDSVELTASWADYSENLVYDPSWTYQEVNARRFGATGFASKLEMVDTLLPVTDGGSGWCSGWTQSGCPPSQHYKCVDDAPGSPDGDATRMYSAGAYLDCFDFEDATMNGVVDSVVLRVNAKRTGDAIALGLGFLVSAYNPHYEGAVDLTTSYADYSVLSTEDHNSAAWTNTKINDTKWLYGASDATNRTVTQFFLIVYYSSNVPNQMTQVFVIVYYPEAEGSPRRKKMELIGQ